MQGDSASFFAKHKVWLFVVGSIIVLWNALVLIVGLMYHRRKMRQEDPERRAEIERRRQTERAQQGDTTEKPKI